MKFVTYSRAGAARPGAWLGDGRIADLSSVAGSILELIEGGEATWAAAKARASDPAAAIAAGDVQLLAPIPRPRKNVFCVGRNYIEHVAEGARAMGTETKLPEVPQFFTKAPTTVNAPGAPVRLDAALTKLLDYEVELAVVIGKAGRDIPKERALDHVFGYTIANDVTARDRQVRMSNGFTWYELGRGKAFDTSAPLGPCIVTADEIGEPQSLDLRTRINGELRQSGNTRHMIWSCADLIHFFSINFTLKPGMVIITGTPAGTAWSVDKELGGKWRPTSGLVAATRYCLPGDVIECDIQSIGVLRNRVEGPPADGA